MISLLSRRERAAVLAFPVAIMLVYLFYISKQILEITTYEFFGNLQNCSFKSIANVSSTNRDAIFTFVTSYSHKLEIFIRSIRSTGCRATIYIFTPYNVEIPVNILSYGVKQIIASGETSRSQKSPEKAKWEWYYSFLTATGVSLDRVLHVDCTDSFFFGDPFSVISSNHSLYLQLDQEKAIHSDKYYFDSLAKYHLNVNTTHLLASTPVNHGFLGGGQNTTTTFIQQLILHDEWPLCWSRGCEQGDFNYVFWKYRKKFAFPIVLLNCSNGFGMMGNPSCINRTKLWNKENQIISRETEKPFLFIANYARSQPIEDRINRICPPNDNVKFA